jgi:hypothetical protein
MVTRGRNMHGFLQFGQLRLLTCFYTLAQLRAMWTAHEITEDSRIFVTENDQQTHQVQLRFIHARDISDSLENGTDIDVSRLFNE